MKVVDLVATRGPHWRQLEQLCDQLEHKSKHQHSGEELARFASLYRAACADLALADGYRLPPTTVEYLHQLVGRAHTQLYRSRRFDFRGWKEELLVKIPRRLSRDRAMWLAMAIFWGFFLGSMFLASSASPLPQFAELAVGEEQLLQYEQMYSEPVGSSRNDRSGQPVMFGFYVWHNAGIGLRCFSMGLVLGVGGLFATLFNAVLLGSVFGYMTTVPQSHNFFDFVTAHGPFELTAIVLSSAAGMRLGFSIISTGGLSRGDAVLRAGREAMPTMAAAIFLFVGAALIEGFLSPSDQPYGVKAGVAFLCTVLLLLYFFVLGFRHRAIDAP